MEFSFEGLSLEVTDQVYPPAEDSFLLAKAAKRLRGEVLEVGCGSGIASISCAGAERSNTVLGVDINPEAVLCSRRNAKKNGITNASFIVSDLFSKVPNSLYDAIMFNPPYLPTSEADLIAGPLNKAFDGGPDGRRVLERFLERFDSYLKPGGTLLLIQSSLNLRSKTMSSLRLLGYKTRTIGEERFFFERLFLLRSVKPRF